MCFFFYLLYLLAYHKRKCTEICEKKYIVLSCCWHWHHLNKTKFRPVINKKNRIFKGMSLENTVSRLFFVWICVVEKKIFLTYVSHNNHCCLIPCCARTGETVIKWVMLWTQFNAHRNRISIFFLPFFSIHWYRLTWHRMKMTRLILVRMNWEYVQMCANLEIIHVEMCQISYGMNVLFGAKLMKRCFSTKIGFDMLKLPTNDFSFSLLCILSVIMIIMMCLNPFHWNGFIHSCISNWVGCYVWSVLNIVR